MHIFLKKPDKLRVRKMDGFGDIAYRYSFIKTISDDIQSLYDSLIVYAAVVFGGCFF